MRPRELKKIFGFQIWFGTCDNTDEKIRFGIPNGGRYKGLQKPSSNAFSAPGLELRDNLNKVSIRGPTPCTML